MFFTSYGPKKGNANIFHLCAKFVAVLDKRKNQFIRNVSKCSLIYSVISSFMYHHQVTNSSSTGSCKVFFKLLPQCLLRIVLRFLPELPFQVSAQNFTVLRNLFYIRASGKHSENDCQVAQNANACNCPNYTSVRRRHETVFNHQSGKCHWKNLQKD